jgi:hypothetical protein
VTGFLLRNWRTLLGGIAGAVGGALYAHFVGCRTGRCLLTSNVWTAAIFFGATGALALSGGGAPRRDGAETAGPGGTDRDGRENGR